MGLSCVKLRYSLASQTNQPNFVFLCSCQLVFLWGRLPVRSSSWEVNFLRGCLHMRFSSSEIIFQQSCLSVRLSSCEAVFPFDHLPMISNYVQIWCGELQNNSAQFQLNLPAGAELGNKPLIQSNWLCRDGFIGIFNRCGDSNFQLL